ncbi:Dihydroneopterin aldolase [Paraburkholderia piptadeniae]|uniref:dihydroneopterin aldolase n=1 Tax=Paraburkholderia piptadeniae TaxID=1701573 RepID=A0A1N7SQ55_9BURK|nr:dihydroneopterin aldolase [Paraburkholderia piptadeniae]SIT49086.1 Dihydroneopterin aldolase [Paraburkholderia piptadeniae]
MNVIDRNVIERPHLASSEMDLIFIEGFQGNTVIGIDPDELTTLQPVRIDLWAGVPHSHACDTDRIGDTIDYSKVHAALERLLAMHKMQLLEALAESIAQMLLADFGAHWVRVSLAKPDKFANVRAVGVVIERTARWP